MKGICIKTKVKEEKKLRGFTEGTRKNIYFDKNFDCLLKKIAKKWIGYNKHVTKNDKLVKKLQEIRRKLHVFLIKKILEAIDKEPSI